MIKAVRIRLRRPRRLVPNVYIADGSILPNPGGANPALTIQALAYWVSEHILRGR